MTTLSAICAEIFHLNPGYLQKSFPNFKWRQFHNHLSQRAETNSNPFFSVRSTSVPVLKQEKNGKCYFLKILGDWARMT